MPWYQPCDPRGYSKFYDGPDTQVDPLGDRDRAAQYEVTDEYLKALERAFHQGQFDAGITNVEDTSAYVFDFLAANCITDTEGAYRLGRAQRDMDPGGSVDPGYTDPNINRPGFIEPTPSASVDSSRTSGDMSVVYGVTNPEGQPAQPAGGGTTPWSPQPSGGLFGPSPTNTGFTGSPTGVLSPTSSSARGGINWFLILAIAAGAWFLTRKGGGS